MLHFLSGVSGAHHISDFWSSWLISTSQSAHSVCDCSDFRRITLWSTTCGSTVVTWFECNQLPIKVFSVRRHTWLYLHLHVTTSPLRATTRPTARTIVSEIQELLRLRTLHCVSKKVPTLILSVTLSNLNWFSQFLHWWKVYEICYKTQMTLATSS